MILWPNFKSQIFNRFGPNEEQRRLRGPSVCYADWGEETTQCQRVMEKACWIILEWSTALNHKGRRRPLAARLSCFCYGSSLRSIKSTISIKDSLGDLRTGSSIR